MSTPDDLTALADWLDGAEDADAECARRAALDPGLVAEARGQLRLHLLLRSQFGGPDAATVARIARELAEGPDTRRIRARRIAQRVRPRPAPLWRWALATAALLALVIGGVGSVPRLQCIGWVEDGRVVLHRGGETAGDTSRNLRAGDSLEAQELSRLRFNDGTLLTIDAGTRLELLAGQSLLDGAAKRLALSTGNLQAEVAKQPAGSPLTITTPEAELTVVGTAFLLARQAEATRLLVGEGRVRMSAAGSMREIPAGGSQRCDRSGFSPPDPLRVWPLVSATDIAIPPPPDGPRLRELAGSMLIGSATFADWYTAADRAIVLREHNAVQAVCYGAYGAWSAPGVYDFADFNRTIDWAVANDKQVIMHVLFGNDAFLPSWLRNGGYTGPQLEALMDDFFKAIITSNGNNTKVSMWNVINEVCNLDGNGFETSVLDALGWEDDASGLTGTDRPVTRIPVYIRRAFEIARKYTDRDLELRDHSIEMHMTGYTPNTYKPKMFYQLCRHLLAKGAPLTAVGIQGHVTVEPTWGENTWNDHATYIRKLKALGLKVYITENTVQPAQVPLAADWDAYQRGKIYAMMKAEREAGIDGFFTWGLRCDADPSGYHRGFNSMPFTLAGAPRPYHYGMQQAMLETQPAPPAGTGTGLSATYFSDMTLTNAVVTRTDATVDFDWGGGSPASGVAVDSFSVRWTGKVQAQFSETYTFTTLSNDGVRLWVNGQQLVDNWADHGPTDNSGTITLVAGQKYDVKMEFYENSGGAVAKLSWASASTAKQIIPMSQLFPNGGGNGLPAGWTAQDVGSVALAGSTTQNDGTWTVTGSGTDIWNSADGCRFACQRVSGDVQVTARVSGLTNTDNWAKAGVMIRESLTAGSRHASTFATLANGIAFQRRTATNGSSSHTAGPSSPTPYWVRIERLGNVLISSASPNGSTWTEIRRETISMGAVVYVGLAVTSHNNGVLCTGTFTNVQVVGVAAAAN